MPEGYYLVSACLMGIKCRYDGSSVQSKYLRRILQNKPCLLVCPEKIGGLPTPRPPAPIVISSRAGKINPGIQVWNNLAEVRDPHGKNLTAAFKKGAMAIMNLIRQVRISRAYLKSVSPSCGSGRVYTRDRETGRIRLVKGDGVFTVLLKKYHIKTTAI